MRLESTPIDYPPAEKYNLRQRMLSGSLSLAVTGSFCAGSVLAHTASPAPTYVPATTHGGAATNLPNGASYAGAFTFPTSHSLHLAAGVSPHISTASPLSSLSTSSGSWTSLHSSSGSSHGWHTTTAKAGSQAAVNSTPSADDLELNSGAAIFSAGSLAGFHQITIDIGGKEQVVNANTQLTAAELVAAQQVLSGGKQDITINGRGIATGGYFDLNSSTVSALDTAMGGNIASLFVSHGVQAIDTLANLNLTGSLTNLGTIDVGAASGSKGQTTDTITAANITNGAGAVIASAGQSSGVNPAAVSLDASGSISNSGKITSATDLNITAPTINNSGLLSAATGNVNLSGGGGNGNLTVNGTGGTVQAAHGNINLDTSSGNGNIAASGGNWLSQNLNLNAGTGSVTADLDEVSGIVNVTAGCAHLTASTANLQLGDMNVSGDPTYFNTSGNISITGTADFTADTAIVASGNIIGGGGTLNVSTSGNSLTLVAGANFTTQGGTGTSVTDTGGNGDSSGTQVMITDSTNAGLGSKTGGFIDLSGSTLGGGGTPVTGTAISTNNGNITMIAYKGTGTNSGSIVGTGTAKSGGASTINAGTGDVLLMGGGSQLTAQNITGNDISILAGTPSVGVAGVQITNGTVVGSWTTSGNPSITAINLTSIDASGNVSISTGGAAIGSSKVPLDLSAAGLAFTGTGTASSLFVNSQGTGTLTINPSSLAGTSTFSVNAAGAIDVDGSVTAGTLNKTTNFIVGGTVDLTAAGNVTIETGNTVSGTNVNVTTSGTGTINTNGTGLIYATTSIITNGTGDIGTAPTTPLNIAANTLTIKSGAALVDLNLSASASGATSLLASTLGSNGSFVLNSAQPITISGALTATSGTLSSVSLTETGVTTKTTNGSTTVSGITIGGDLDVDATNGSVNLTTTGNENITERSSVITAGFLTIDAAAGVGTTGSPIQTNIANQLIADGNSANSINIKDLGTNTFTIFGTSTGNEAIDISSKAATFVVGQLFYSDVSLSDTTANANTTISTALNNTTMGPNTVGDSTGNVTINVAGSITQVSGNIQGQNVTITSTGGTVASTGANLMVNAVELTANATKGAVNITTISDTTFNGGTALNNYNLTAGNGTILDIAGSIKATLAVSGQVTLAAGNSATINQTVTTAAISAPIVALSAGSAAIIGVGTGFESIETKAGINLTIQGDTGSSVFVTQSGSITLSTNSTGNSNSSLNLAVSSGTMKIASNIDFANLTITAPTSLTLESGFTLTSTNLTINTPQLIWDGIIDTAGGNLSIATLGTLAVSGSGTFNPGTSVSLSGVVGITLGQASGGTMNPLSQIGGTGGADGPLQNLTIFTTGVFSGAYTQFQLSNNASFAADSLSITASSIKNTGTFNGGPLMLSANGTANTPGNSNSVILDLTGTSAVTLGTSSVIKGQLLQYDLIAGGSNGSTISVTTGGALTVSTVGALNFGSTTGDSITLVGHSLVVTSLLSNYFSGNQFNSVTLGGTASTFYVGASTAAQEKNGIEGGITATFVNITSPSGVFVEADNITAGSITINTSRFELADASSVIGQASGPILSSQTSLAINSVAAGGLTIGGINGTSDTGGSYTSIANVVLQSSTGSINVGQLFTSNTLLGNGAATSIALSANGSITLPNTLQDLQVASGGVIFLNASSLSYTPKATNPFPYLTFDASGGSVTLSLRSSIILGQARGDLDIAVGSGGSYAVTTTTSLTVSEVQSTTSASLTGSSVTLNDNITASGTMLVQATNETATGIKENGALITASILEIGLGNDTIPLSPTAIKVSSPDVIALSGALSINDTFAGSVSLSSGQSSVAVPLEQLFFTSSSGVPTSTLTLNNITTNKGELYVQDNNGTLSVASGANLTAFGGNLILENNDLNGNIIIQPNATVLGSSTGAEGGFVLILMGPIPFLQFALGAAPSTNVPIISTSGGGIVLYSTAAFPQGTITTEGLNFINAFGRDVAFNGAGNNSAIVLEGGDTITGDPPAGGGSAAAPLQSVVAMIGGGSAAAAGISAIPLNASSSLAPPANSLLSNAVAESNQGISINQTGSIPVNNWSLPTTLAINSNLAGDLAAASTATSTATSNTASLAGLVSETDNAVSISTRLQTSESAVGAGPGAPGSASKLLKGNVSNAVQKTIENGVTLLAPKTSTTLETGFGTVHVAAGAVALVMAFDGGLALYDLHDTRRGAVSLTVGEHTLSLTPGRSAVFTDRQIHSFEEINPAQMVAYRSVAAKNLEHGVKGFEADFSVPSMLKGVGALRDLLGDRGSDTRKAVDSILKTTAILSQFGGAGYEYMRPAPLSTASLK